jgi:hypothetical protein
VGLLSLLNLLSVKGDCSWTVNGHTLDLSDLQGEELEASDSQFTYTLTICEDDESCNGEDAMAIQTNQEDECVAYLAQYSDTDDPSYSSDDGGTWEFSYDGESGNNCDERSFTFIVVCDEDNEIGDADCEETDQCDYEFTFYTSYACVSSSSSSSGMSGGSVFLLILFLGLILYCGGGYAYKAYKNTEGGWKDYKNNTPHLEFWMTVPLWTKAGCLVSKEFVMTQYFTLKEKYDAARGGGGASAPLTGTTTASYQQPLGNEDNM